MNKLIFGNPRSGTKLIAKIYQDNGYHNFGEFFNSFSAEIVNEEIPYAVRTSRETQAEVFRLRKEKGWWYDDFKHSKIIRDRFDLFKKYKDVKSIVTVWEATFQLAPETFELINDRNVLCTRRNNKFEQLLSRCITKVHFNYDEEVKSTATPISTSEFEGYFRTLTHVEALQDQIVKMGKGVIIDFDDLISGKANLGFEYSVKTKDQHSNLEDLVLNLDEIKEKFNFLIRKYNKSEWACYVQIYSN